MRKVIYSEYVNRVKGLNPVATNWQLEEMGEALFHQFGIDHQDCEFGVGNFSTAIIELEDGTVKNIPAEYVRFISGELMHKVTIEGSGEPGFDTIKELKKESMKGEV